MIPVSGLPSWGRGQAVARYGAWERSSFGHAVASRFAGPVPGTVSRAEASLRRPQRRACPAPWDTEASG